MSILKNCPAKTQPFYRKFKVIIPAVFNAVSRFQAALQTISEISRNSVQEKVENLSLPRDMVEIESRIFENDYSRPSFRTDISPKDPLDAPDNKKRK